MSNLLKEKVLRCLPPGDVLLVVPPFAGIDIPSMAAHLLQACAKEEGIQVAILYANMALASVIGESCYEALSTSPELVGDIPELAGETFAPLAGERFFAHSAYGTDLESLFPSRRDIDPDQKLSRGIQQVSVPKTRKLAEGADDFLRVIAECIASKAYRVVGCSSTFEQTSASIGLFNALKAISPQTITIIGGGNCEGDMAKGMSALATSVDYVFAGESEKSFPAFLHQVLRGERCTSRIVTAESAADLETLPLPDFGDYFEQLPIFLPTSATLRPEETWLPYESSRGCWWGVKHKCTFCGLNGENINYRKKDASLVLDQLRTLLAKYPTKNIFVIDNIMPYEYFKTLMPGLEDLEGLNLFYEQKSNLSLDHLKTLKRAGVNLIQPGIESLSTPLLKMMDKGVTGRQHIHLLRNARTVGVSMNWNLLYDFPSDRAEDYEELLGFMPHLVHFCPPLRMLHLSIERFSPYFETPATYGITGIKAMPAYYEILPHDADVMNIAYHFIGEYESGIRSQPRLIDALRDGVSSWRDLWTDGGAAPALSIVPINDDNYLLLDSRYGNKTSRYDFLTTAEATQLLTEKPVRACNRDEYEWILSRHLMLEVDGYYVPLAISKATASAELSPAASEPERSAQLVGTERTDLLQIRTRP